MKRTLLSTIALTVFAIMTINPAIAHYPNWINSWENGKE